MARGQKQYTEEFKNTIVELYNSGKSLSELRSVSMPYQNQLKC
jgi:transposase